ncbi:MAG: DUF6966 domain-containing protein [Pikeienuella sp.]
MTNPGADAREPNDLHASLNSELTAFIESVARLEAILLAHGGNDWAVRITRVRKIAEASDGFSVRLFLSFFGGMGSLRDLVLVAPAHINDELHLEMTRAYELAKALDASERAHPTR